MKLTTTEDGLLFDIGTIKEFTMYFKVDENPLTARIKFIGDKAHRIGYGIIKKLFDFDQSRDFRGAKLEYTFAKQEVAIISFPKNSKRIMQRIYDEFDKAGLKYDEDYIVTYGDRFFESLKKKLNTKRINENQKVTLTIGQLKKLIKESKAQRELQ